MQFANQRWWLRLGLLCACTLAAAVCVAQEPPSAVARLNSEARTLLRSDPQLAQQRAQQALQLARQDGDRSGEAAARVNLGSVERQRGRYDQAVLEFERAVAITREISDQPGYASAQANLGITLDLGGLHADALEAQGEALKIYEAQGKFASASAVLINLGNTLDNLGDATRARDHYQRALEMKRAHDISKGVGAVLNNLADLTLQSGATEQAIALLDEAIVAHTRDDDRIGQGLALSNRGIAHARNGNFDAALADLQQGEAIARDLEHSVGISAALRARAEVWLLRARSLEGEARDYALLNAEREARAAVVASNDNDDPERRALAKHLLANVLAAKGDAVAAIALMEEIEREAEAERRQRDDARVALVRARYENQQAETEVTLMRERTAAQSAGARAQPQSCCAVRWGSASLRWSRSCCCSGSRASVACVPIRCRSRTKPCATRWRRPSIRADARAKQRSLNQRLLALAGEDLQAPLAEIRSSAERLLAVHHASPEWSRPMAAIARNASDLLQVVQRLRETAHARGDAEATVGVDLSALLTESVSEAEARARQRQQRLLPQITPAVAVLADADALARLCTELLDQTLRRNPADRNIAVALRAEATHAVITLSDHDGQLRALLLAAQRTSGDSETPRRLGLGLLREDILRAGGSIDSIAASAPETGQLLRVLLPLAA